MPALSQRNKPKSQSLHQFLNTFSRIPSDPSGKLLETQRRFFKLKEKVFANVSKPRENLSRNCRFSQKSWSLPKKFADSPTRFYKNLEFSDISRRNKAPSCLIFKETQYNSHKGLYNCRKLDENTGDVLASYKKIGALTQVLFTF